MPTGGTWDTGKPKPKQKPSSKARHTGAEIKAARNKVAPTRAAFLSIVARAEKSKNNPTSW